MEIRPILPWFLILCIVLMLVSITGNVFQMVKAQKRVSSAVAKVTMLEREQQRLIQDKSQQNSEMYLESQIRNSLKMVKPGETLVVVPSQLKEDEQETVYKYTPGEQQQQVVRKTPIEEWMELIL